MPPAPHRPDGAPVAVSVIVPVYNAEATLERTLAALGAQRLDVPYEVIVVDGGSHDATPAILARAGAAITVLHNPAQEPASSRNLGADRAAGALLAFTDADCEPVPDWLATGLRVHAATGADVIQGKILPREGADLFDRTLWVTHEHGLYETANLFVTPEAYARAGGFEPLPGLALPAGTHFGEDTWFVWRARRLGARTAFAGEALVRHAVFRRTVREALGEVPRRRHFPELVALIPELRDVFLHRRWFLGRRTLLVDLALAGAVTALGTRRRLPLAAALPYARELVTEVRRHPTQDAPRIVAGLLAGDVLSAAALLAGSLAARTPVL